MIGKKQRFTRRPLRLGFVPLNDCAPIVMAHELDLFSKYGIAVELSCEVGWATIRDKIVYGELDAAHAPAPMVFAAGLGLGSIEVECLTGLVLNLHGNAITLSAQLWKEGVRDGQTLRHAIRERDDKLTFGVVFPFSSHNFLFRQWLQSNGIDPDRDVRMVVVPPPQMAPNLKAGNLDGYCVGEPWNSVAVLAGTGWCVATSSEISPQHPEKVLMVRREFAEAGEREHLALIAALYEACRFCAAPENRERIIETLARPQYVNASPQALRMSLCGTFDFGHGRVEEIDGFHIFHGGDANEPSPAKAAWVIEHMVASGAVPDPALIHPRMAARVFRADIFHAATRTQPAYENNSHYEQDRITIDTPSVSLDHRPRPRHRRPAELPA